MKKENAMQFVKDMKNEGRIKSNPTEEEFNMGYETPQSLRMSLEDMFKLTTHEVDEICTKLKL